MSGNSTVSISPGLLPLPPAPPLIRLSPEQHQQLSSLVVKTTRFFNSDVRLRKFIDEVHSLDTPALFELQRKLENQNTGLLAKLVHSNLNGKMTAAVEAEIKTREGQFRNYQSSTDWSQSFFLHRKVSEGAETYVAGPKFPGRTETPAVAQASPQVTKFPITPQPPNTDVSPIADLPEIRAPYIFPLTPDLSLHSLVTPVNPLLKAAPMLLPSAAESENSLPASRRWKPGRSESSSLSGETASEIQDNPIIGSVLANAPEIYPPYPPITAGQRELLKKSLRGLMSYAGAIHKQHTQGAVPPSLGGMETWFFAQTEQLRHFLGIPSHGITFAAVRENRVDMRLLVKFADPLVQQEVSYLKSLCSNRKH